MELQAAAGGSGHLDQQIGRVGRQRVAGQRGLRDVDCPIHHLELPFWAPTFSRAVDELVVAVGLGFRLGIAGVVLRTAEPAQHRAPCRRVEK